MNSEILTEVKRYRLTFKKEWNLKIYTDENKKFVNKLNDLFSLYGVVKSLKKDNYTRSSMYEKYGFKYHEKRLYIDKNGNIWNRKEIATLLDQLLY